MKGLPDTLVGREVSVHGALLRDAPVVAKSPMRFAYLIPRDYPIPYDPDAAYAEVKRWVALSQEWFRREIGMSFDAEVVRVYSDRTIYELSGGYLDGCDRAAIPEGEGAAIGLVLNAVWDATGWPQQADGTPTRLGVVMTGAGGWAGAQYFGQKQTDYGWFLVGDWGLYKAVMGQPAPCNPWPDLGVEGAFGHELLHACDTDSDSGAGYFLGDVLSGKLRTQLKSHNRAFLSDSNG